SSPGGWDSGLNVSGGGAPDESLHRAESLEQLYEAIAKLPDDEREVVDLVWLHELSQAEAATLLGITLRTVGRRWRRARLRLFAQLRDSPAQD
ncbi:MAG: sigma-70 family RNA polymerase sigma factor, partial [Planctomycetaceae bacterium]|nr:sigma-70 family RNA polymerase sigma factor [Planctomycetaceae bacterium]